MSAITGGVWMMVMFMIAGVILMWNVIVGDNLVPTVIGSVDNHVGTNHTGFQDTETQQRAAVIFGLDLNRFFGMILCISLGIIGFYLEITRPGRGD
jgi:hypothetical protein